MKSLESINWFHRIPLGNGVVTPGLDDSAAKLDRIHLPGDLSGKRVLDIGAWDGYFSFECERRNAREVVALDSYCWSGEGWGTKDGFEFARKSLGSRVKDMECEVEAIAHQNLDSFDVVLMLGVLYHVKDPFRCMEAVSAVSSDLLILETVADLLFTRQPAFAFYQGTEMNNDPTNWWAPNIPGLIGLLKAVGYKKIVVVSKPKPLLSRIWRKPAPGRTWLRSLRSGRVCVHAFKTDR